MLFSPETFHFFVEKLFFSIRVLTFYIVYILGKNCYEELCAVFYAFKYLIPFTLNCSSILTNFVHEGISSITDKHALMKGDNETPSTIGIKLRNIVTYIEKKYIDFSKNTS